MGLIESKLIIFITQIQQNKSKMKNKKVLFICKKRNATYGVSIGLVNSAQFIANFLNEEEIPSKVVMVIDSNFIDKEVHHYKPTHVILQALWVPPYKLQQLAIKYPNIIWQTHIHSKIPFLAHEGMAIEWITEYYKLMNLCPNIQMSANSKECKQAMEISLNEEMTYLPNMYVPDYPAPQKEKHGGNYLNIGCFGAIRPFKNQLIQAMSAMAFGDYIDRDVYFHINCDRPEQNGQNIIKNIKALFGSSDRHHLVECKWENHSNFLKVIAKMDICMQVSLSETYNIVTADSVYVGVPTVVSDEIQWMPNFTKTSIDDINKIVSTLAWNLKYSKLISWTNKKYLNCDNKTAGKIWLKYLKN